MRASAWSSAASACGYDPRPRLGAATCKRFAPSCRTALRDAREYLLTQINRFGGNISRTAEFVGMERSALHRKLKSLGVVTGAKGGLRDEADSDATHPMRYPAPRAPRLRIQVIGRVR